jgi:hypothetical protein
MATKKAKAGAGRKTTGKRSVPGTRLHPLAAADARITRIAALSQAMNEENPDPETALALARESAEVEKTFRGIRELAEKFESARKLRDEAVSGMQRLAPSAPKPGKRSVRKAAEALVDEETKEASLISLDIAGVLTPRPAASASPASAPIPPGPKLTDIFVQVSEAVIEAQLQLDQKSIEYVTGLTDPRLQPSVFSIPTVKAETKVALTDFTGSGLFVKILGSPADKTNYSESTVSFDIVAAPPPPDGFAPMPSFLVLDSEKDAVLEKAGGPVDDSIRARATVFRSTRENTLPYLLLIAPAGVEPGKICRVSLAAKTETETLEITDANALAALREVGRSIRDWELMARPGKNRQP